MDKEKDKRQGDCGGVEGPIYVVGIGPGGLEHLTFKAREIIASSQCVVGYTRYVELISPLLDGKEVFATGMTKEVERCSKAVELARGGRRVAVVSSGDAGIYGMAGVILQLVAGASDLKVEVIPGVPAFVSAGSLLGAPLMHDFASISLSDLLTPWDKIEERLQAAAKGDFVIVLYNPKSGKRTGGLKRAVEIIGAHRRKDTPAGIVRNAAREEESVLLTTLSGIIGHYDKVDMLTIVIIGNSATFDKGGWMITPRGYKDL